MAETEQEKYIGIHPSAPHIYGVWLNATDLATTENKKHRVLEEVAGERNSAIDALAQWIVDHHVPSRFNDEGNEMYKKCFEEMSLMSANGLPTKWATQIYVCGINSRQVSTELSMLIDEPEEGNLTLSKVAYFLRDKSHLLIHDSNCSELAKSWLKVFLINQASYTMEVQKVNNFNFGKDESEDIPDFLVCKKKAESSYLCSADMKYIMEVKDTEGLPFSSVADIPGVFFRRDGGVWKMGNINPYVSITK